MVSGCDFSGTSTQISDLITCFQEQGKKVRDIRGTEDDALFHAERFSDINSEHLNLDEFSKDSNVEAWKKVRVSMESDELLAGRKHGTNQDLRVASFVINDINEYIDPNSADVWIME